MNSKQFKELIPYLIIIVVVILVKTFVVTPIKGYKVASVNIVDSSNNVIEYSNNGNEYILMDKTVHGKTTPGSLEFNGSFIDKYKGIYLGSGLEFNIGYNFLISLDYGMLILHHKPSLNTTFISGSGKIKDYSTSEIYTFGSEDTKILSSIEKDFDLEYSNTLTSTLQHHIPIIKFSFYYMF